jgi:hypothetical protein
MNRRSTMKFKVRWDRLFASLSLGILLGFMGCWALNIATDRLPPCQSESDSRCYWDASEMGNGIGQDFIAP